MELENSFITFTNWKLFVRSSRPHNYFICLRVKKETSEIKKQQQIMRKNKRKLCAITFTIHHQTPHKPLNSKLNWKFNWMKNNDCHWWWTTIFWAHRWKDANGKLSNWYYLREWYNTWKHFSQTNVISDQVWDFYCMLSLVCASFRYTQLIT